MWYRFVQFIFSILFRIIFRLKVVGRENIPKEGALVIACNHVSNLDPPMVGTATSRPINFMAKSELFENPILGWLYASLGAFPVHRGAADAKAIRTALTILKHKEVLGIFPEGHRMTEGKLGKAEPGALAIAIKGKAALLPAAILGSNMKARKSFWPQITVVFGKPMSLQNEQGNKLEIEELSVKLMEEIGKLIASQQGNL